LLKVELTFKQATTIEMKSFLPQIGFVYCLTGKLIGYRQNTIPDQNSELSYQLSSGKGMIYATAASHGWMQLEKAKPYQAVYLLFSYEAFQQLIGDQIKTMPPKFRDAINSENGYFTKFLDLSSPVVALCKAIFKNPYTGKSQQFYREAKVIELIAYQIDELTKLAQAGDLKLTAEEEILMEYCHQVLLSSLENPPSLIELAEQVGMSDYRLKTGFKQMYGLTPFRFVVDQRMLRAKELLQTREMTVGEVALTVGFTSVGSFSNSFYEKFGIRPSELKRE
jgi:AraC-like DNA-binding protein